MMDSQITDEESAERFGIAELALQHGADITYKYKNSSLLQIVCNHLKPNLYGKVIEVVSLLSDNGCDPNSITLHQKKGEAILFLLDIYSKRMTGDKNYYYKTITSKNSPSIACFKIMKRYDYSSWEYIQYALTCGYYKLAIDKIAINRIPDNPLMKAIIGFEEYMELLGRVRNKKLMEESEDDD